MNLTEIYSQHYFHELERKDNLNNSLTIPIGVVSVIFGALIIVIKEIEITYTLFEYAQIACIVLTLIASAFACVYICKSLLRFTYWMLPNSKVIEEYNIKLNEYYLILGKLPNEALQIANSETISYATDLYIKYSNDNAKNNDKKSALIFKANSALIIAVIFLAASSIPYLIKTLKNPNTVQKVEITNLKELRMNILSATNQNLPPVPAPVKPAPPPGKLIREHVEKPTKK